MTRTRIGLLATLVAIGSTALAISACGGSGTQRPKTAGGKAATVGVASVSGLGRILVDSQGHTLYLFQKDSGTHSACTAECAASWPPLRADGKPSAGAAVAAGKLATAPRSDGRPQVTYNGHPLYLFAADKSAGDANGQGVNAFGALWYAMDPAGAQVTAAGPNPGGSGY